MKTYKDGISSLSSSALYHKAMALEVVYQQALRSGKIPKATSLKKKLDTLWDQYAKAD